MSMLCAVCRKTESVAAYRPFCSKRCADVDLGRWFNGGYSIPTDERPPEGFLDEAPDESWLGFRPDAAND